MRKYHMALMVAATFAVAAAALPISVAAKDIKVQTNDLTVTKRTDKPSTTLREGSTLPKAKVGNGGGGGRKH